MVFLRFICRFAILLLFSVTFFSSAFGEINADLKTSRLTGVAPLTVFFDASASTSSVTKKPFSELHYQWYFGDPESGHWKHSDKPKNLAYGPLSAHVYDKPGTYQVLLTVTNENGETHSQEVEISVLSPEKLFAGANTVCFSSSGNFSGCPTSAKQVISSDFETVINHLTPGKRLLLRRGDTWQASSVSSVNSSGPGILGAFGFGDKPLIESFSDGPVMHLAPSSGSTFIDWRIMDLEFKGANEQARRTGTIITGDNTVQRLLVYRVTGVDFHSGFVMSANSIKQHGSALHANIAFVDSKLTNMNSPVGGNSFLGSAEELMLIGNEIIDSTETEQVIRIPLMERGIIAHNLLFNPTKGKPVLNIHSQDDDEESVLKGRHTEKFLVSDNRLQGGDGDWMMTVGPKDAQSNENVRTGIIERNYFMADSGAQAHLVISARDMQIRNNIFNLTGGSSQGIKVARRGVELNPVHNAIYNNTCYSADTEANAIACITIGATTENSTIKNNLLATPFSWGSVVTNHSLTTEVSHSLLSNEQVFTKSNPVEPNDFNLHMNSIAINAGTHVSVYSDFDGVSEHCGKDILCQKGITRADGFWDVGAYELSTLTSSHSPHYLEKPNQRNQPPVVEAGPDQTIIDNDEDGYGQVMLNAVNAYDPDGSIISWVWQNGKTVLARTRTSAKATVTLPIGVHRIKLSVFDNHRISASDVLTVMVKSSSAKFNQPPTAAAGKDQVVKDTDKDGYAQVVLDGSGSYDPEGKIASYIWRQGKSILAMGAQARVTLPVGTHAIKLTVIDDNQLRASDGVTFSIVADE